jgi:hypothetical protein
VDDIELTSNVKTTETELSNSSSLPSAEKEARFSSAEVSSLPALSGEKGTKKKRELTSQLDKLNRNF